MILNIGGQNELSNLNVAKQLVKILGMEDREEELITFVPDRKFNDLRYTINSSKLEQLGWVEQMPWEEGLKTTVDWFKEHSGRFGNIEDALVAHPRIGVAPGAEVTNESFSRKGGKRATIFGDN